MKDLTIHIAVAVEEDDGGPTHKLFEERLYLALPPEVALGDATHDYLVGVATTLVYRALAQTKQTYQPELEVTR